MKILVTGANGLLGQYLIRDLTDSKHDVTATGRGASRLPFDSNSYVALDITDKAAVNEIVTTLQPDVIIHAAAMAQPDACELNKEDCWKTNVLATQYFSDAAEIIQARFIYISTDFVFSGEKGMYSEEDETHPVNYYGESKLAAENIVKKSKNEWAIIRTVLVYGNILKGTRSNVVTWVKDNLEKRNNIKVVNDQIRTPTYVEDLAKGIQLVIEKRAKGIYNITGKEIFTPYEMAVQVADYFGLDKSLMEKVDASVFTQPAQRPLKTGLTIDKAEKDLGYEPVNFKDGIRKMFPHTK